MNILLIGALPPPVGGTTVLFKQLVDDLRTSNDISIRVIDVSRPTVAGLHNALHAIRCLALLLQHLPWASIVSFHASLTGATTFGPVVHMAVRLFRRKWVFRGFGGDLDAWHRQAGLFARSVFDHTVLRADRLLLERKSSVAYFTTRTSSPVEWYPNSRRWSAIPGSTAQSRFARRFVFVGHVKPAKGIKEIIQAAQSLAASGLTVDVYGPLQDGVDSSWFAHSPVTYRGPLVAHDVIPKLSEYDVLLMPSYALIEGYPGIILEAYCAGIPVIATRWGGIPEIVTSETGILVEPRDVEGLASAMRQIMTSEELRARLRAGARQKATEFDAEQWTMYFIRLCDELTAGQRG